MPSSLPFAYFSSRTSVEIDCGGRAAKAFGRVELGPGDYLAWDPSIPHDVENVGDGEGRILVVYPRHGRRGAGDRS